MMATMAHKRTHQSTGRFLPSGWDETTLANVDGETNDRGGVAYPVRGFSRVDATYAYSGDIEGTGTVAMLIAYRGAEAAPTFAFEQFVGSVDGHDGSFLLQHVGEHDPEAVRGEVQIIEGSGTGGLTGISGEATVELKGHSEDGYPFTLRYDL